MSLSVGNFPEAIQENSKMIKKQLRSFAFGIALVVTPVALCPVLMQAQQVNEDQRAYQTGYQNGVNAARANRPMNNSTDDWHGDRLTAYQQGYQEGYNSVRSAYGERGGQYTKDPERERAYQTGYQNGVNAARNNRPMNMNSDDWHGDRLQAYEEGYQKGYRSIGSDHHDHDHDDH